MGHSFDDLTRAYARHVALPWQAGLSPAERVWILWYDSALELRVAAQTHQFETATRAHGHGWSSLDLGSSFGRWIADQPYLDRLTRRPAELGPLLPAFAEHVASVVASAARPLTANDVLALSGLGALFGLASVSNLIERVAAAVPGRLLAIFPGSYTRGGYSLLDARESWNYHAIPIPPVSYI